MHVRICKTGVLIFALSIFIIFCGFEFNSGQQNAWDFYDFDRLIENLPEYNILLQQDFEFDFKPIEDLGYIFSLPHEADIGRKYYHIEQNPDINLDIAICDSYEDTYNIFKASIQWREVSQKNMSVNKSVGDIAFFHDNWILFIRANVFFMISDENQNITNALKIAKELDRQLVEKLSSPNKNEFKIILAVCCVFAVSFLCTKINRNRRLMR